MKKSMIAILGIVFLGITLPLSGEDAKSDMSKRFLLLATRKTSTMQKELSAAAAVGYRILVGSHTSGTEVAIILEKVAAPPNVYDYYVLATTRTSTMEKELNEQAARGFRLLPGTMTAKDRPFGGVEIFVVMEKAPGTVQAFHYRLLATNLTGTMQNEMAQAASDGYQVVGMVSRGEHIVILEKPPLQM